MLSIVHGFDWVDDLYVCIDVIASNHQFDPHGKNIVYWCYIQWAYGHGLLIIEC